MQNIPSSGHVVLAGNSHAVCSNKTCCWEARFPGVTVIFIKGPCFEKCTGDSWRQNKIVCVLISVIFCYLFASGKSRKTQATSNNTHKGCTLTAVNLETLAFPLALFRSRPNRVSFRYICPLKAPKAV